MTLHRARITGTGGAVIQDAQLESGYFVGWESAYRVYSRKLLLNEVSQSGNLVARERNGVAVALRVCTAVSRQEMFLLGGFDAFGNNLQAESVAQADDGLDDLGVTLVDAESGHEAAVDLDRVERVLA